MNNTDIFGCDTGNATDCGKTNGVVSTHDQRDRSSTRNMRNGIADLIKRFLDIGWDREYVSNVT
jgi:hypothetical protein